MLAVSDTPVDIAFIPATLGNAPSPQPAPSYTLSPAECKGFMEQGYMKLPHLVSSALVEDALRTINMALGQGPSAWTIEANGDHALAPEVRSSSSVMALLYSSGLHGVVEQMLGSVNSPKAAQLALRFPNDKRDKADEQWHIDGMKKRHMSPFQLLVGVALSAQPTANCGNLAVWPGKHTVAHEAVKRARGGEQQYVMSAAEGNEEVADAWCGNRPILGENTHEQLMLEPGDVVIAHQRLPHRITPNRSPNIRYMVYFRLSSLDHQPTAPVGGLFDGFPGLQEHGGLEAMPAA